MRTITTILFLLITFCTASAKTYTTQQCWGSDIILSGHYQKGDCNPVQTRSLSILPIAAFLDGTDLYIEFSSVISDLNITLIKDGVEVENRTISVEVEQCEVIDLSVYGAGNYQIVLTTPQGTYLSGEFLDLN